MEAAERPRWTLPGTFTVLPTGYEDEAAWLVVVGAREWLVDGQADLMEWDAPAILVDKITGRIDRLTVIEHLPRLSAMWARPVAPT